MKQIALTAEDFDTLDTNSSRFEDQFLDPEDCPIYRALTRAGHKIEKVGVFEVDFQDGRVIRGYIGSDEVYRCADELRAGAKVAIIKL